MECSRIIAIDICCSSSSLDLTTLRHDLSSTFERASFATRDYSLHIHTIVHTQLHHTQITVMTESSISRIAFGVNLEVLYVRMVKTKITRPAARRSRAKSVPNHLGWSVA